jgi:hypothetical protein
VSNHRARIVLVFLALAALSLVLVLFLSNPGPIDGVPEPLPQSHVEPAPRTPDHPASPEQERPSAATATAGCPGSLLILRDARPIPGVFVSHGRSGPIGPSDAEGVIDWHDKPCGPLSLEVDSPEWYHYALGVESRAGVTRLVLPSLGEGWLRVTDVEGEPIEADLFTPAEWTEVGPGRYRIVAPLPSVGVGARSHAYANVVADVALDGSETHIVLDEPAWHVSVTATCDEAPCEQLKCWATACDAEGEGRFYCRCARGFGKLSSPDLPDSAGVMLEDGVARATVAFSSEFNEGGVRGMWRGTPGCRVDAYGPAIRRNQVQADGSFFLDDLAPGLWKVVVSCPRTRETTRRHVTIADEVVDLGVLEPNSGTAWGRVSGIDARNAWIGMDVGYATLDPDGSFIAEGLPEDAAVRMVLFDQVTGNQHQRTISAGETVDWDLER